MHIDIKEFILTGTQDETKQISNLLTEQLDAKCKLITIDDILQNKDFINKEKIYLIQVLAACRLLIQPITMKNLIYCAKNTNRKIKIYF